MTGTAAVLDFDPFGDAFLADPYPFHTTMREAGPVVWLSGYGVWGVARHEQVTATLLDPVTFCSSAGVGLSDFRKETPWRPPSLILEADPPLHTRTHKVLARVLSPAALRALRAGFERVAVEMIDDLIARERFDAVTDLAQIYPIRVFGDAIGLPEAGREHLLPYGNMAFNAFGPRNRHFEAAMTQAGAVSAAIAQMCERASLAPDGIGARVYDAVDAGEITESEANLLVRSLLTAGLDTTVNSLGNALLCLARFPAEWQRLRADPKLARGAFDEMLRFEAPVQTFFRTTTKPATFGDVAIGEGEKVLMFLAAAGRDPRKWHEPDRYDITRRAGAHVAFGAGIHRCVGEPVARMEGEIVLAELARRAATLELDGEPQIRLNNTLRGFEHIPMRVTAARS